MLLVGVPSRHRPVPRNRRNAAHDPLLTRVYAPAIDARTPSSISCARWNAGGEIGASRAEAHGHDLTAGDRGHRGARRRFAPRAAHARSAPSAWNPGCSLYFVRSIARHWLSRTSPAEHVVVQLHPGHDGPHLRASSWWGTAASRRPSGCPWSRCWRRPPGRPSRSPGTVAHRSAGTSGSIGLSGSGSSEPPQPDAHSRATSTDASRTERRRPGICPPRRHGFNAPHSTTAGTSGG